MRIIRADYKKDTVRLAVETNDDVYFLQRVLETGDLITGSTTRKVKKGAKEEAVRKHVTLTLRIEKIEFKDEPLALRVNGKIVQSSDEDVALGSYHSLELGEASIVTVLKKFSAVDKKLLEKAAAKTKHKLILLAVLDYGEAHFGMLTRNKIKPVGSFEKSMGRKDLKDAEKNRELFLREFLEKIRVHLENSKAEIAIIGAVGFVSDALKNLISKDLKPRVRFAKVSTNTTRGLHELIARGEVAQVIKDDEISKESTLVMIFFEKIQKNSKKVSYGLEAVHEKAKKGGVETLLVSDARVRDARVQELIERVEEGAGSIELISAQHERGEEFLRFGGIGALTRF
ncbi:mRNA surveillance protein pelota [archaeon CG10_big_fil_rev_8_21_14_0_10_43_11]|nr:MAG: mRNA surveillance protein pelota [archaeon CG10_big_fil_rev_8_21_14_0_10_43_11]